jgi:hypothetical protein
MIKNWTRDIALAIQAKSGLTPAFFVWLAIGAVAGVTAFIFLCVAAYDWLSVLFGSAVAGLIVAGVFIVIALFAVLLSALARRRARERAILARAARAHAPSWLLDPKILATGLQMGRSLGWQRIVPLALLGFLAAQWAREQRQPERDDG